MTSGKTAFTVRPVRISHRVDYGVRLVVAIAELRRSLDRPVTRHDLLARVDVPEASLLHILGDLRKRQIVRSRRGVNGGWDLARPASDILVGDVIRALEGPLTTVRGRALNRPVAADPITMVWQHVGAAVHAVLDSATIADVLDGRVVPPAPVRGIVRVAAVDPVSVWGNGAPARARIAAAG